jgi:hypothetical protein
MLEQFMAILEEASQPHETALKPMLLAVVGQGL